MADQLPIVILSTADFDAPVWTNKQHIAVRLAGERAIYYIESLGLRAPRLNFEDVKRVMRRLSAFILGRKREHAALRRGDGIKVLTPFVLPWHGSRVLRLINRGLIHSTILRKLPKRYILWSFSPITYGLAERAEAVIYHSVDLLHTLPGLPREALLKAERQLIARADAVVVSSKGVRDHIQAQGRDAYLWENVADVELFKSLWSDARERRAIFVGNLTQTKINFSILEGIVERGVRLALAGPSSIDGTQCDQTLDRLLESGLVEYLGVLSQEVMAAELGRSWVGIIPYQANEYTSGVFPMKVYEYLSAGLPVVATPIPSLAAAPIEGLELVGADEFAERVAALCSAEHRPPAGDYSFNSWTTRMAQIGALLIDCEKAR